MVPSVSHQAVYQPIWRELSLRGHQVTVLTTSPLKDPKLVNLTEIDLGFTYDFIKKLQPENLVKKEQSMMEAVESTLEMLGKLAQVELAHPEVQALIKDKTKHFDVMLVEFYYPTPYALSARFSCPMIGITSADTFLPGHDAVGNPTHPVVNPDLFLPFLEDAGFFERAFSTFLNIWFRYYHHYHLLPEQDKVARKYIDEDLPYLGDIEKNVSMLFLNINPIIHRVRPNVPAVIELGNMHIVKKKPLPSDLQKELDAAKEGVVYFSLGSNVKSANLSIELRKEIMEALSELPYKVFWKWEDDHLPGKPKNVVIRKWFPQQDVLGHPNIKVFLTQAGLQSMEEAISNGVSLVGLPFSVDQPINVAKMVHLGIGQGVDFKTLTKEQLKTAILEVANNPKYRNRMREIADLTSDVLMTSLEKAVWWTEYVIRHKGARHLRSPAVDMPWYQYFLLDVIGLVLGVIAISVFIFVKIIGLVIRLGKKLFKQPKLKVS